MTPTGPGGSSRSQARPTHRAPGRIGYYSDGALHVAVVIVSGSGRRLFIEHENDVLHTNVGYPSGIFD